MDTNKTIQQEARLTTINETWEKELTATDLMAISGGTDKKYGYGGSLVSTGNILSNNDDNNTNVNVGGVQPNIQESDIDVDLISII